MADALTAADHPDRAVIFATIDDAEHFTDVERARIVASYPEHERDARTKGVPVLGSGRVFPVSEESIRVEPFALPASWPQIVGIDFGWDHPFGAARLAWDRDNDTLYVTSVYRERQTTPVIHAAALKPWGTWLPVAWPHDGLQHDKGSGQQLAQLYRDQGLDLLAEHATHEEGGFGLEAGIFDMLDRMKTGRFKVFQHCAEWFDEFRLYHREKGLIVKERDDVLSASRIGLMMRRHAIVKPKATSWKQPDNRWVV